MAFLKLSSQMEDHNFDLSSETLHKNGDFNTFSPHHIITNPIEKQNDLLELLKTHLQKLTRVGRIQIWHSYATDPHQSALNCHRQQN